MRQWVTYFDNFYNNPNVIIDIENRQIFNVFKSLDLSGKKYLDYGCGVGYWTWIINDLLVNGQTIGVDISEECINICKTRYPAIKFFCVNENGWVQKYDLITLMWVLQEITCIDELNFILRKLASFLDKDGVIFVVENQFPSKRKLLSKTCYGGLFEDKEVGCLYFFDNSTLSEPMNNCGLYLSDKYKTEYSYVEKYKFACKK